MTRINRATIGSSLDDFLEKEELLNEVTSIAHKRVLSWQIRHAMDEQHLTKVEMAERMKTSRAALDRLLNPNNSSVTLDTMDRAATALGKRLSISLND